jgi:hypothetical protein
MKRIIYVFVSVCLLALATVSLWPSQSDSSNALSMVRAACGLEKIAGQWEFDRKKAPTTKFEDLSGDEQLYLEAATRKNAILAQRAAFLDSQWLPLAEALAVVNNEQILILANRYPGSNPTLVDSKIKVYYKCNAVREESNS